MPKVIREPSDTIDRLTDVFRTVGYDGATLSKLSEATGLQRASLYHRFPGGKKEMAEAVLRQAGSWVQNHILGPLAGPGSPRERLEVMVSRLDEFYSRGDKSCLLDSLTFGAGGEIFGDYVREAFSHWIKALTRVVVEATECSRAVARRRAEDAIIRIQGALVLARGARDNKPFLRAIRALPDMLLEDGE